MRMILVAVLGLAFAAPASAQQLTLTFREGRVTLDAAGGAGPHHPVGMGPARRHQGRRRRTHHRRPAHHPPRERHRSTGAGSGPAQCGRLHGRAPPRRVRGRLGLRPHPRDADQHRGRGGRGQHRPPRREWQQRQQHGRHAARRPGRRAATAAGGRTGDAGRGATPLSTSPRSRSRSRIPSRRSVSPDSLVSPAPSARRFRPARSRRSCSSVPAPGGQAVTVNPTQEPQMPVMQFPGAAPAGNGPTGGFGVVGSPTPGMIVQPAAPPARRSAARR